MKGMIYPSNPPRSARQPGPSTGARPQSPRRLTLDRGKADLPKSGENTSQNSFVIDASQKCSIESSYERMPWRRKNERRRPVRAENQPPPRQTEGGKGSSVAATRWRDTPAKKGTSLLCRKGTSELGAYIGRVSPVKSAAFVVQRRMIKLLEHAVETVRGLPTDTQDEIARLVLQLAGDDELQIALTDDERAAIGRSKAAASRGEFATDEQVRAVWSKPRL